MTARRPSRGIASPIVLMLLIALATSSFAGAADSCPAATVCFTPRGNCTDINR
jgi:hypothetical protein